jgi:hypothetical protein
LFRSACGAAAEAGVVGSLIVGLFLVLVEAVAVEALGLDNYLLPLVYQAL